MRLFRTLCIIAGACCALLAQPAGTDEITLTNGDKLVGHFVRATDASVVFKTDALGELTIPWKNVRELHSSQKVAVIRHGVKLSKKQSTSGVPQGTLSVQEQNIQLAPSAERIPVVDAANIVDAASFQNAMTRSPSFFQDWKGTLTAGVSLVEATQNSRSFNGAVSLVRAEPAESWLNPRNRTDIEYSQSYGEVTEPGVPTVKTSIYYASAQRDQYITPSLFLFGQAVFNHNYSQGLDLQQTYMGGFGWTAINDTIQVLDLKASVSFIHQDFSVGPSEDLIGSVFAEHYSRKLPHSAVLEERAYVAPAWNNTDAWSAYVSALLTLPVYKHLGGSIGVIDSYLNNPPPSFKKNSVQFTLGLTYTIQ